MTWYLKRCYDVYFLPRDAEALDLHRHLRISVKCSKTRLNIGSNKIQCYKTSGFCLSPISLWDPFSDFLACSCVTHFFFASSCYIILVIKCNTTLARLTFCLMCELTNIKINYTYLWKFPPNSRRNKQNFTIGFSSQARLSHRKSFRIYSLQTLLFHAFIVSCIFNLLESLLIYYPMTDLLLILFLIVVQWS